MKYSETGQFTANQEKLAKEIADRIKKLRKSGCTVLAKSNMLCVYKTKDMQHAQPLHLATGIDYQHSLKFLDAGNINDAGADDTEYFEPGYITEE